MTRKEIIAAFAELGSIMAEAATESPNGLEAINLRRLMDEQYLLNSWFTPGNVRFAVESVSHMISRQNLETWLKSYPSPGDGSAVKTVALVMAGNLPLVGFHDLLCVLASGNRALVKTSSKDPQLTRGITEILCRINPQLSAMVTFTEGVLGGYDAIIATGSNNTQRYFDYYFGNKPHLFRKNRSSVTLVTTETTDKELKLIGRDIFSYFGLGCRNVSKLFLSNDIDPGHLTQLWANYSFLSDHPGWANNYLYNKAIMEIENTRYLDGRFFLLTENTSLFSPVSVIHYQRYKTISEVLSEISLEEDQIQCVTGPGFIPFGNAQFPDLWDYADNIDTMNFLLSL